MSNRYRLFLGRPGAPWLAVFGLVGRLPNGMLGLVFVLVTVRSTGSYAMGGLAAALYTVGTALAAPVWSRSVDRIGPRTVLVGTGAVQSVLLAVVAALTLAGDPGPVLLVVASLFCGALLPPLGSVMRTLWSRMFTGSDVKDAAFAYESVVVDVLFIVGPSLVALLSAFGDPAYALIAAAVATAAGCLCVAWSPHTVHVRRDRPAPQGLVARLGPLRHGRVLALLPVGFLLMGSIVVIEVTLVAFAGERGTPGVAGWLIAVLSVGGVAGGLWWGARRRPGTNGQQLTALVLGLGAGWALLALPGNPWVLGILLVVAGLVLNPAITAQFSTMDDVAPEEMVTESFGWLNAVASAGSAAGAAVAGQLVTAGSGAGFLLAAGMCVAAFVIALLMLRVWRQAAPVAVPDEARDEAR